MEFSLTDSTNLSEPCECPLCSRNMTLPNQASLRSSNRNIEHSSFATDMEPKMRQEESENVENSVAQVAIAGMIEDGIGETEKEPLAEAISTTGCSSSSSSSSFSLKLTEAVNMVDEVDSVTPPDAVDGYQVKPEYMPILEKILSKYGDIARNCTILTIEIRSSVMEMICGIISELQEVDLYKINEGFLLRKIVLVNEFKDMKVEIEWLHQILDDILEARKLLEWYVILKEDKENNRKVIENAKRKMDEWEEMVAKIRQLYDEEMVCKEALKNAKDESTRIKDTIKYALSKVKPFVNGSLVDDLI